VRQWAGGLALCMGIIFVAWRAGPVQGQSSHGAVLVAAGGSEQAAPAGSDGSGNGWPDNPFGILADGELWLSTVTEATTGQVRTVAALQWSDGSTAPQIIDVDVTRVDGTVQRLYVDAPGSLAQAGETAVLLVAVAEDLVTLLGPAEAAGISPYGALTPLRDGRYVEVSVLISADGGATYDELDESRLKDSPIRLRIERVTAPVDIVPALYAHPTFIASDAVSGIAPVAERGMWSAVPTMTLPYTDAPPDSTEERVLLEADLRSLSVFAPMAVLDGSMASGTGTGGSEFGEAEGGGQVSSGI